MRPFGETLVLWREARGLTQAELALLAHVPRPNLSAIERGARDVSLRTVRVLARALSINPGALVDGQSPEILGALSFDRRQLDRIAQAAARGQKLLDARENEIAMALRQAARSKLEALRALKPLLIPRRTSSGGKVARILRRIPKNVLANLIERLTDHAQRIAYER